VVWHTQGSGKSLTMTFYAGKIIQALNNPTLVVLTDRNDLDNQLFAFPGPFLNIIPDVSRITFGFSQTVTDL